MKKISKLLSLFVVLFMICGCGSKGNSTSIKIGCSGPLTGSAAVYGTDVNKAALLAIEEINEKEGTKYFDFNMQDDVAEPEKATSAYGSLKDWGMQVSLFTVTSGAGAAVASDYTKDRIFALTPSGSNTSLIFDGNTNYDTNFQMCFTDPNQGVGSADYIAQHNLGSKIGIIYKSDDNYSTGVYDKFVEQAKKNNLNIVKVESFDDSTQTDFSAQIQSLQNEGCDLVFLPIYYTPASIILTQSNSINYKPLFFGVDGLDGILGLDGFDTKLAEGVFLLTPFAADATDDLTVKFVKAYEEKYHSTPTQFAADAYDCVYALYQACKNANITYDMNSSDICDLLIKEFTTMTFTGLTGECTWNEKGEVSKDPKAVVINNGVYVFAQ